MTPSSPEIPDSISPETLRALLGRGPTMAASEVLPALDFGGDIGAPCDLQLVLGQLIQKSACGISVVQMLTAAMHLLHEVQIHLSTHLELIRNGQGEYAALPKQGRAPAYRALSRDLCDIKEGIVHVNNAMASFLTVALHERASQYVKSQRGDTPDMAEFRSNVLISDEILAGLNLDRSDITQFLQRCIDEFQSSD